MANITNPRKEFNFSIQVVGAPINPFLVQDVTLPEISISQAKHGDTNYDVKTAGRVEIGELEIEKIMSTSGADNYFFTWAYSCQDIIIGGGNVPNFYKRSILVQELAEDGTSVINTWVCTGCWPMKINGQKLSRKGTENSLEKLSISVDRVEKL
jgi:phage tail-like protein